jgi:hypothetical protein
MDGGLINLLSVVVIVMGVHVAIVIVGGVVVLVVNWLWE